MRCVAVQNLHRPFFSSDPIYVWSFPIGVDNELRKTPTLHCQLEPPTSPAYPRVDLPHSSIIGPPLKKGPLCAGADNWFPFPQVNSLCRPRQHRYATSLFINSIPGNAVPTMGMASTYQRQRAAIRPSSSERITQNLL